MRRPVKKISARQLSRVVREAADLPTDPNFLIHKFIEDLKLIWLGGHADDGGERGGQSAWSRQVDEAGDTLEERLIEMISEFETDLHDGQFDMR